MSKQFFVYGASESVLFLSSLCAFTTHKNRYAELVRVAFSNEPGFVAALDKASRRFLNSNAVAGSLDETGGSVGGSASKSPELLARYCDQLLKKGGKSATDTDVEKMLEDILIVFKVWMKKVGGFFFS
jgi:hypothetical protein